MRTLNDYFIDGGGLAAIETGEKTSAVVTIPDGGSLIGIAFSVTTATTVTHTFDIYKNSSDTLVDATASGAMAANSGLVMTIGGEVSVAPGDRLHLKSNDETDDTTTAYFNWIIRR